MTTEIARMMLLESEQREAANNGNQVSAIKHTIFPFCVQQYPRISFCISPRPGKVEHLTRNQPTKWHPGLNSEDDMDFAMETGGEQRGITEEAPEDIEEDNIDHVTNPVTSHELPPLPSDFQPLGDENHPHKWCLPYGFGCGSRVYPPQGCTNTCSHAGHGEGCASTAPDFGISVEDRWVHATRKKAGIPEVRPGFRRRWKQVTVPESKIWLGLIIYMSVVGLTELMNIRPRMSSGQNHCLMKFKGLDRFANIKRFFHVSPPGKSPHPRTKSLEEPEPIA